MFSALPGYEKAGATASLGGPNEWNPTDFYQDTAGTPYVLSNGNRTVTKSTGINAMIRGIQFRSTGKRYIEFLLGSGFASGDTSVGGMASDDLTLRSNSVSGAAATAPGTALYLRGNSQYFRLQNGTASLAASLNTWSNGDIAGFAMDLDAGKAWVFKNNVIQQGSATAGTSPIFTFVANKNFAAVVDLSSTVVQMTIAATSTVQTYAPPTGFIPWA